MEQSIGAQLFDRTTRSVLLTAAGERLAEGSRRSCRSSTISSMT
ncbi:MAG: hypothetical protein R2715_11970 [Ilumatobacteraceae bacterium]